MSALMRKHHTEKNKVIFMHHAGISYRFPIKIAEKYKIADEQIDPSEVFLELNEKYTKPGALLKGIRARENITQFQLAKMLKITQSDVSQMENGRRRIGRIMAKRIEELFDVNYKSFLE